MITITPHRSPQFPRTLYFIDFTEALEEQWVRDNIVISTMQWMSDKSFAADSRGFVDSFISEAQNAGFPVKDNTSRKR